MSSRSCLAGLAATALLFAASAAAQAQMPPPPPQSRISAHRHPNLAAATRLMQRADQRIIEAQRANEWDLDGHAARAKQLLEQAEMEMKLAAQASNHDHR